MVALPHNLIADGLHIRDATTGLVIGMLNGEPQHKEWTAELVEEITKRYNRYMADHLYVPDFIIGSGRLICNTCKGPEDQHYGAVDDDNNTNRELGKD